MIRYFEAGIELVLHKKGQSIVGQIMEDGTQFAKEKLGFPV